VNALKTAGGAMEKRITETSAADSEPRWRGALSPLREAGVRCGDCFVPWSWTASYFNSGGVIVRWRAWVFRRSDGRQRFFRTLPHAVA